MCFAINSPWEVTIFHFLRLTTLLHVGNPSQGSATIRTGLPQRSVVMRCFNLFIREQTRLMVPSPPWAKKMGKKELLANALYRPAKSPEEKNWGKPRMKLLPFDGLENS